MQVTGKIKIVGEEQTFGAYGFRKRELVITTSEQYPQTLMIEFVQDHCDLLNNYQVGQDVQININLRGREWVNPEGVTKYINSIQGWSIQLFTANNVATPATDAHPFPTTQSTTPTPDVDKTADEGKDDLPF